MVTTAKVTAGHPKKTNWLLPGGGGVGGGLLGWLVAGPVGAGVGVVLGGAGLYFFGAKVVAWEQKLLPASALQALVGGTPAEQPHMTVAQQVATSGTARPAAQALYAYLKVHGPDGSSQMSQMVSAFQTASNSDPNAIVLSGPLPISAVYDPQTSAALTLYTGDPIPAATPPAATPPPPPAQVSDYSIPGSAATSGFNLMVYLQAHGNSPSDLNLQHLVKQFQLDFNTDPKSIGPAAAYPMSPLIKTPLPQTGIFETATAAALSKITGQTFKP